MMKKSPVYVSAGACYVWSQAIKDAFTFQTHFGDQFTMYRESDDGDMIMVPRNCAPAGKSLMPVGEKVVFDKLKFESRNEEQTRIVTTGSQLLMAGDSFIIQAGTGTGKTVMSMPLIAVVGRKTAIIVTKEDVKVQWVNALKKFLGLTDDEIGYIQGGICDYQDKKVVVCMVHSVSKRDRYPAEAFQDFGFVITDECHRIGADTFSEAMWNFPAFLRLGLSATPKRKDGKDLVLHSHIGPILIVSELPPLKPTVIVKEFRQPVLAKIPHKAGKTGHITKILVNNALRNEYLAEFMLAAYRKDRNIVFFSDSRDSHLLPMKALLISKGIPDNEIDFYVGGLTEARREKAKRARIVLATYKMCSEATDAPWWDTAVLGTPRSDVVQIAGRVLREYPGKNDPVIFDLVDVSSPVFKKYYAGRAKFYQKVGAKMIYK